MTYLSIFKGGIFKGGIFDGGDGTRGTDAQVDDDRTEDPYDLNTAIEQIDEQHGASSTGRTRS